MRYLANCIWLILPIAVLNALFAGRLPKPYQPEVFDRGVPPWIAVGENGLRVAVFLLPLFMPLRVAKLGLALYFAGVVLYALSWAAQIRYPCSAWSTSRAGFLAPAYTPLVWLVGIGLIGDSIWYIALAAVFLGFHNTHAWLVYSQTH